jgi:hypothetical protein
VTTTQLLGGLAVVVAAGLYYYAVRSARRHVWSTRVLAILSTLSGVVLIAMVLTDWPSEELAHFWADHSIFAAVVSSLLMVSVGYLAFEAGESAKQTELSRSVTSAGLSGFVDHLVDVDIALAMLTNERAPAELDTEGRPLRWMRPIRERLQAGGPNPLAPSSVGAASAEQPLRWRQVIVDQCIRRIIVGMRDWAALVGVSEDGRLALIHLGRFRLALVDVQQNLIEDQFDPTNDRFRNLRSYIQLFAVGMERLSTPNHPRPGLTNFLPGGLTAKEVEDAAHAIKAMTPPTVGSLVRLLEKRGHSTP